jgi:hypothetical protein
MSEKQEEVEELLVKLANCKTKEEYNKILDRIIKIKKWRKKDIPLEIREPFS